jgi:hypothetical protein
MGSDTKGTFTALLAINGSTITINVLGLVIIELKNLPNYDEDNYDFYLKYYIYLCINFNMIQQ